MPTPAEGHATDDAVNTDVLNTMADAVRPCAALSRTATPHTTHGLANLGNTCFLNASLQLLARCSVLGEVIVRGVWPSSVSPTLCALQETLRALRSAEAQQAPHCPRAVQARMMALLPRYRGGTQEDADEALRFLLDDVATELGRRGVVVAVLEALFCVPLSTVVRCGACGHQSVTRRVPEPVLTAPLVTDDGREDDQVLEDVAAVLAAFQAWTPVPEWRCTATNGAANGGCGAVGHAGTVHCVRIDGAPRYIVLTLKRYGRRLSKFSRAVTADAPVALRFGSDAVAEAHYMVRGGVLHSGGALNSGHYTAIIDSGSNDGTWLMCNDARIMPVSAMAAGFALRVCYVLLLERYAPGG